MEFDGYERGEQVAVGGSSVVYRAHDTRHDRVVAIKVLNKGRDDTHQQFSSEIQLLGRLGNHANIITILDSGFTESGQPYVVTPYFDQGSFADIASREGALPWRQIAAVGVKVADALATVHEQGVLHRDIKPANIFVGHFNNGAVLGDFGISSDADPKRPATENPAFTLQFASPEVVRGERVTAAADIYSLGATLYALVNGAPAYRAKNTLALADQIVSAATPPALVDAPPEFADLVASMMAARPEDRPPSAADVRSSLNRLLLASSTTGEGAAGEKPSVEAGDVKAGDVKAGPVEVSPEQTAPWHRVTGASASPQPIRRRRSLTALAMLSVGLIAVGAGVAISLLSTGDGPTTRIQAIVEQQDEDETPTKTASTTDVAAAPTTKPTGPTTTADDETQTSSVTENAAVASTSTSQQPPTTTPNSTPSSSTSATPGLTGSTTASSSSTTARPSTTSTQPRSTTTQPTTQSTSTTSTSTTRPATSTARPSREPRVFRVAADASVIVGTATGYSKSLRIVTSDDLTYHTYLRFELAGLDAPITKATLNLTIETRSADGGAVYRANSNDWDEIGINGLNAPGDDGQGIVWLGDLRGLSEKSVDVTRAIEGNGTYSFVLRGTEIWGAWFVAKETDSSKAATLTIETE